MVLDFSMLLDNYSRDCCWEAVRSIDDRRVRWSPLSPHCAREPSVPSYVAITAPPILVASAENICQNVKKKSALQKTPFRARYPSYSKTSLQMLEISFRP